MGEVCRRTVFPELCFIRSLLKDVYLRVSPCISVYLRVSSCISVYLRVSLCLWQHRLFCTNIPPTTAGVSYRNHRGKTCPTHAGTQTRRRSRLRSSSHILIQMFTPLRIVQSARSCLVSRSCSGFVSRMRYVNKLKEDDDACVAALQTGQIFLFHKLAPLLQRTKRGTFTPALLNCSDVQSVLERLGSDSSLLKESVLIGCSEQNQAQFCLDIGQLHREPAEQMCDGTFEELRKSFFLLTGAEAPLVAKAQALLRWHQINGFCSATGQPTRRNQAGSHRVSSGGSVHYPTMAPVVLILVTDGKRCLLGRQASFPRGMYSALAGFCDMGETLEETLHRELAEEVGLEMQSISYSSSQHWPFPHSSFMLGCHATVSSAHTELKVDHSELEDARWFNLEEVSAALQVKVPPRRGDPPVLWVPPKHALGNRLIAEWAERQRGNMAGQ